MNNYIAKTVFEKIKKVTKIKKLFLHEPTLSRLELKAVNDCIKTGVVSSSGKQVELFEKKLSKFTKSKYAIAIINGTSALHISLLLCGVKEKDEVLVPSLTFVATANAIRYCNAIPHFIDSREYDLGVDAEKLFKYLKKNTIKKNGKCFNKKTNRFITAIIPVYVFGHPYDIPGIKKIARHFNLKIIEDATEALGTKFKGKHAGTFGDLGVLSFNGNKIITTGGGGAILTNNKRFAEKAKHLSSTAKLKTKNHWDYVHDDIGYNYKLPSLNAALGLAQMKKLNKLIFKKRKLFKKYQKEFEKDLNFKIMKEPSNSKSNYWLQTLFLKKPDKNLLNKILKFNNDKRYRIRPVWKLLNTLKPYKSFPKMDLSCSKKISYKTINLPSSSFLIK